MEFDNRSVFEHHIVGEVTERISGDILISVFVEDDEDINVAGKSTSFAADCGTEDVQFGDFIAMFGPRLIDERVRCDGVGIGRRDSVRGLVAHILGYVPRCHLFSPVGQPSTLSNLITIAVLLHVGT
ncbi:hypothetical protein C457_11016 [Haloferax prahovense DSM 18310]|uniref:Uncharacterized protein n=1 Tax=Haloferax prahovense (strain DSM 18310 / JCM 13924 / TL6) TaxID=1227461 RepID=M0GB53_HALPT|nr:hypothetical protein C457_11016 [Haloferax prahovense DSM 18310]